MTLKNTILVIMLAVLHYTHGNAQCTALSSGNWTDPTVWSCGYTPGCGDIITIPAGITVTLDDHLNIEESDGCFTPTYIRVSGTLKMQTGKKIYMSCGSTVEIMVGGLLETGTGGGSSNLISICGNTEWQSSDGDVPGYAIFGSPIPLPVTITAFQFEKLSDHQLQFFWNVESERDVNRYEIESSVDGTNWELASSVVANGSATYMTTTSFQRNESTYFRLRSVDNDGKIAVYDEILFNVREVEEVLLYPNPSNSGEPISILFANNNTSGIAIYDQTGKLVYSDQNKDKSEHVTIEANLLKNGFYVMKSEVGLPVRFVVE